MEIGRPQPESVASQPTVLRSASAASVRDDTPRGRSLPARGLLVGAMLAIAVAGATWFGVAQMAQAPAPHVGITTTTGLGEPFGSAAFMAQDNQMTNEQWQERTKAFEAFTRQGPVALDRVAASQIPSYLSQVIADPGIRASVAQKAAAGEIEMVAIGLYDDCAEDGDVVRIQTGDIDVVVPLFHQVNYVQIPIPKGQSVHVLVSGIKDGTGGITLGMVTPRGTVHMPRLQPGQQLSFEAR